MSSIKHCASSDFAVSATTGRPEGGAILSVRRIRRLSGPDAVERSRRINGGYGDGTVLVRADHDGRWFPSSDEAFAFAVERGYCERYFARTWCREHRCLHTFLDAPSPALAEIGCLRPDASDAFDPERRRARLEARGSLAVAS